MSKYKFRNFDFEINFNRVLIQCLHSMESIVLKTCDFNGVSEYCSLFSVFISSRNQDCDKAYFGYLIWLGTYQDLCVLNAITKYRKKKLLLKNLINLFIASDFIIKSDYNFRKEKK